MTVAICKVKCSFMVRISLVLESCSGSWSFLRLVRRSDGSLRAGRDAVLKEARSRQAASVAGKVDVKPVVVQPYVLPA